MVRPRSELFLETPASGSQESPAGGEGSGGDAHAPCPWGGLRAPALVPAGRGGKAREGEGRARGKETGGGVGAASRPTLPPPREQRVPAAAPCRPQSPAPRGPAQPLEGRRGSRSLRGRGNPSRGL